MDAGDGGKFQQLLHQLFGEDTDSDAADDLTNYQQRGFDASEFALHKLDEQGAALDLGYVAGTSSAAAPHAVHTQLTPSTLKEAQVLPPGVHLIKGFLPGADQARLRAHLEAEDWFTKV